MTIWIVFGGICAAVAAIVLAGATAFLTRGRGSQKRYIFSTVILPFVSLAWVGAVFLVQASINVAFLGRDSGIGDSWRCPLPVGYAIGMIDVTDYGSLVPEKRGLPIIGGVRTLQVSGSYVFGGAHHEAFEEGASQRSNIDHYFVLDARSGTVSKFSTREELSAATRKMDISVALSPIEEIYFRYRPSWVDYAATATAALPPLLGFVLLRISLHRFRHRERKLP